MRPVNWLLPASVVWIATRNEKLADGIATRRDIWAADEALKSADRSREVWKSALAELTDALRTEVIHAVGLDGTRISSAAWMVPVRSAAQGLVAGATVERKATRPGWVALPRVVGGIVAVLRRSEVVAAFPASGEIAAPEKSGPRRVGRPPNNNELYIERAAEMFAKGDREQEIRAYLKKKIAADLPTLGVGAITKRISNSILPAARLRAGKKPLVVFSFFRTKPQFIPVELRLASPDIPVRQSKHPCGRRRT